jgi:hypothetical protein
MALEYLPAACTLLSEIERGSHDTP